MKGSNPINDLTPENRDDRNGDFTGESLRATPSFTRFMFMFCFTVICKIFLCTCGVRISKALYPGRVNLRLGRDIIDNSFRGLPRALDYAIKSHIAEAFWR